MNDEDAAIAGRQARSELNQTEAAFEALKAAMLRKLVETPTSATETILTLHKSVQILEAVRKSLMDVVVNGQVADAAIASAGLNRR